MVAGDDEGYLRIGELSRRVGVAPDTLRAWERRYGLMRPSRTEGGFRLYSAADEGRVRAMQAHLATGLAPAQAARRALTAVAPPAQEADDGELGDPIATLRDALEHFDETRAHTAIDQVVGAFGLDSVLLHVVLPYLRDLGDRWERGEATVAQEHFASTVLRARLMAMARGWDEGGGPRALLACAPEDLHDIPLVCLGLALRARGWRITMLGAATPVDTLLDTALRLGPEVTVIAVNDAAHLEGSDPTLRRLASVSSLVLAGPGAGQAVAARVGARLETGDPVNAARRIAESSAGDTPALAG